MGRRFDPLTPEHPTAVTLIDELSAELASRYVGVWPLDGRTNYVAAEFDPTRDAFLVGYLDDEPTSCGALRHFGEGVVEVKRMYVRPAHRGQGWGRDLLAELEAAARRLGYSEIVLETGSEQPEALGLYAAAGYGPTLPWPPYDERPYARCFRKVLHV